MRVWMNAAHLGGICIFADEQTNDACGFAVSRGSETVSPHGVHGQALPFNSASDGLEAHGTLTRLMNSKTVLFFPTSDGLAYQCCEMV